jgi:hypothetical protein
MRYHKHNILIVEDCIDGDVKGDEAITELVEEASVPTNAKYQGRSLVLDFTFWAWRARHEGYLCD